jgi:hypothetical protein
LKDTNFDPRGALLQKVVDIEFFIANFAAMAPFAVVVLCGVRPLFDHAKFADL